MHNEVYVANHYAEDMIAMYDVTSEKLGKFKIFEGLSSDEIDAIISCGNIAHFKSGAKIIEESSESSDLYVVLSGRASIEMMVQTHLGQVKRTKRIAVFKLGDVFGDMAFLSGTRRSASVATIDDFSAMIFDHDKLYGLFDDNSRIGYIVVKNIAKIMANRLMQLNFQMRDY
jgi:CRP/FNR family cyclic AMP-dependent transcriptional regulator